MPDYWTHTLVADGIVKRLGRGSDYLYLGTHGPDLFFYVNQFRLFHRKKMAKIGNRIHSEHTRELFRFLFRFARSAPEQTVDYLAGFVAHYAIDAACHGYVYERTRTSEEHKYLELHLDRYLVEHYFKVGIRTLRSLIRNIPPREFGQYVAPFYIGMCREVHGVDIDPSDIATAGQDIGRALALSLSPAAKNLPFKSWISKHIGIDVTLMIHPEQPDPNIDYERFVELLGPARETAFEAVRDYYAICRTAEDSEIEAFIGRYVNRDFNGVDLSIRESGGA